MNKQPLNFRLIADLIVMCAGLALFFGAWVFGIQINGILLRLLRDLGAANSPQVNGKFLVAFHGFDSFREFCYILGLLIAFLGGILLVIDASARKTP